QLIPLYEARKNAIDCSNGDIFAFLDVDDIWEPDKLDIQVKTFKDKNIGLSCTNYFLLNERKNFIRKSFQKKIPEGFILEETLRRNYIGMSTLMVTRKAYESLKYGFDTKFEIIGDYDLVLRLLVNWKLAAIQEPLSYYRWHGNNLSIKKLNLNADELIYWINEMKSNNDFSSQKNFKYLESHAYCLKGLSLILNNERFKAIRCLFMISNFYLFTKLLLFISIPKFLISMIRS
ncbi:glycosyltransferase, partial [Pelagibacteraceae bacterium]|nr:glycosyltransferase [Pelagibacteraceae bacterium]